MTTEANGRKITSAGDGATTVFSVPQMVSSDFLYVYLLGAVDDANEDGELLSAGSDYTLTGDYRAGTAQITCAVAPAADKFIRRFRLSSRAQGADYIPSDGFPADTHELQLDRLSHITEELDDDTLTNEEAVDLMDDTLVAGTGIELTFDDDADTITITNTFAQEAALNSNDALLLEGDQQGGLGGDEATAVETVIALIISTLTAGVGISLTPGVGTLTIAATGALSNEQVLDLVHGSVVQGDGLIITVDDPANSITIDLDPEAAAITAGRLLPVTADGDNIAVSGSDTEKSYAYLGTGGHTATIDDTLAIGALVTIYNKGTGNLTIAGSGVTLTNAVAGGTGSFTIPPESVCTIHKLAGGVVYAMPSRTV